MLLVIAGTTSVALGFFMTLSTYFGTFFFLFGFALAAVGGYASQAHMLKIKPFDNAYKKAKEGYKEGDENEN